MKGRQIEHCERPPRFAGIVAHRLARCQADSARPVALRNHDTTGSLDALDARAAALKNPALEKYRIGSPLRNFS
jgi:hypothetical protein